MIKALKWLHWPSDSGARVRKDIHGKLLQTLKMGLHTHTKKHFMLHHWFYSSRFQVFFALTLW